ncbi:hypothetical protein [Deinococcus pimensis]|uniref:hypothetical protein n=1 Tax=Deinococcus pimensis TaxID=309888 RepID=UPI0004887DCA|nr:hypothetical protein [Deinococcus pimensis]
MQGSRLPRRMPSIGKLSLQVALALTASLTLTVGARSTQRSAGPPEVYRVTSSLDGLRTLPAQVRWVVTVSMPGAGILAPQDDVDRVDFLIDGQVRWYAKKHPYTFASPAGWLIPTFLAPGRHSFTATFHAVNGDTASDTVIADVVSRAPAPPAALAGRWTRQVSGLTPDDQGNDVNGRWDLIFDEIGAWVLDPLGTGAVDAVRYQGDTVNVYGTVAMGRPGVDAYGAKEVGAGLCEDGGPGVRTYFDATFRWAVKGNELTMTSVEPGCEGRRLIWSGTWTRVSSPPPRGPLTPSK